MIFNTYKQFFNFIIDFKKTGRNNSLNSFFKDFITLYITDFLIRIFFLTLFILFFGESPYTEEKQDSIYNLFFVIVFLGPIIEEMAFRLSLVYTKLNIFISTTLISYYLITKFIFNLDSFNVDYYFFYRILISLIIGCMCLFLCFFKEKNIKHFYNKNLKSIIYLNCILFSAIHFNNFNDNIPIFYILILLIPYFISSLIYSYLRLKYSFIHSTFSHIFTNFISTLF